MNFEEQLKILVERISTLSNSINTEEATKTALILPFFQLLGYDIFNPNEFVPEFISDVGIKKGEKVDYAIKLNNEVSILIEAKSLNQKLEKHDSQLFRYFSTSKAKFAILTNGINYRFFTDLEQVNVMDSSPFLDIRLDSLNDNDITELRKFQKDLFDIDYILSAAADLKYLSQIKKIIKDEFNDPSDEFIRFILNKDDFEGKKTQSVLEKYKPLLRKSINQYINEIISDKFKSAFQEEEDIRATEFVDTKEVVETTNEELEAFYIVKSILAEKYDLNSISYKDTLSYFGVLYDNKVTKWICRICLKDSVKYIIIPDGNKNEVRYDISNVSDIYLYKKELYKRLDQFMSIEIIN